MIKDEGTKVVQLMRQGGFFPDIVEITGFPHATTVEGRGKICVNFASNDYLAFSRDPKVLAAAAIALQHFGIGSGGSRITAGTHAVHSRLESKIAQFKGTEDAVIFSAGYLANVGILPALMGLPLKKLIHLIDGTYKGFEPCEMFLDRLVHASILDGLTVATSPLYGGSMNFQFYQHLDMADLDDKLKNSVAENKLIVTDGVFSLHGHLAPLDQIVGLARKYDAEIYVDDAHGSGIFGSDGRGTAEHFGVESEIDFPMGTLSKALGGAGGYFAGSRDMCDYLRVACRTHVYQTAMPPVVAAGLSAAFDLIRDEPRRRVDLLAMSNRVNHELISLGFDTLGTQTQIIPVRFGDAAKALRAQTILFDEGIFAPRYYYPAVPKGEDMVRVNLMSAHTDSQIDQMLVAFEKAGKVTGVI